MQLSELGGALVAWWDWEACTADRGGRAGMSGGPAIAADLEAHVPYYKAAPLPVVSVDPWSGLYLGGNIGYGWSDQRTDADGNGGLSTLAGIAGFAGFPANFAFTDSTRVPLQGALGGAQIGYNYQLNPRWVVGFEADVQSSDQRASRDFIDQFSTVICTIGVIPPPRCLGTSPLIGTAVTGYEAKIGWFGTVRGRVGFLLSNQILVYGTGGLAYGRVEASGSSSAPAATILATPGLAYIPTGAVFSAAKTNAGYSVGGGFEGKLYPWLPINWTWKLEYLHLDLGSLHSVASLGGVYPGTATLPLTGILALNTHFLDSLVRVGLNYKFAN